MLKVQCLITAVTYLKEINISCKGRLSESEELSWIQSVLRSRDLYQLANGPICMGSSFL